MINYIAFESTKFMNQVTFFEDVEDQYYIAQKARMKNEDSILEVIKKKFPEFYTPSDSNTIFISLNEDDGEQNAARVLWKAIIGYMGYQRNRTSEIILAGKDIEDKG